MTGDGIADKLSVFHTSTIYKVLNLINIEL
jgi:hypothetical protein